jgi:hypothetical protein
VIGPPVSDSPWEADPGTHQPLSARGDAGGERSGSDLDGVALPLSLDLSPASSSHSATETPDSHRLITHMRIGAKLMLKKPG